MRLDDVYTVVMTARLSECRDFYARWFGFSPVFEATWFVYLRSAGDPGFGLALMHPDHPSRPPGREVFGGTGLLLTLQVPDAATVYAALTDAGLKPDHPLADEPWGQRRFGLRDPAGVWVDVVEQIEPAPGFWGPYLLSA